MLGFNRNTISAWFSLYEEKGLEKLLDIYSPSGAVQLLFERVNNPQQLMPTPFSAGIETASSANCQPYGTFGRERYARLIP